MEQWILAVVSVLFAPALVIFWLAVFLAAIGRSMGVTKLYIKVLLFIFEVRIKLLFALHFLINVSVVCIHWQKPFKSKNVIGSTWLSLNYV